MKKIVILLCIACIMLVGCNNSEQKEGEATVYGVTGECPVKMDIKVDGDGKVSELEIEEYLSVYDMGKLEEKDGKQVKFDIPAVEENGYAKYVRVGDKVFEYRDGKYVYDEGDYSEYIAQFGAEYIHYVTEGDFDLLDENGNDLHVPFDVYDKHKLKKTEWADKMKNGYHEGVEYSIGWKEDIYNLVLHVKNHGFYDYTGNEKAGESGTYKVGKYDTLVSQTNFHDYMQLALKAYKEACKNIK